MEEAKRLFDEDPREPCRFGVLCYQKNPKHHEKFKHYSKKKIPASPQTETKKETKRKFEGSDSEKGKQKKQKNENVNSELLLSPETKVEKSPSKTKKASPVAKRDTPSKVEKSPKHTFTHELSPSPEKDEETNTSDSEGPSAPSKTNESSDEQASCTTKLKDSSKSPDKKDSDSEEPKKLFPSLLIENDKYNDPATIIRILFLTDMPDDFYSFYDFCSELNRSDPSSSLQILNLKLVGPYDVLNGKIHSKVPCKKHFVRHWRYYLDPPEFQTILTGNNKEGLHYGYWRDEPNKNPVFVAKNSVKINSSIKPVAENIFGAVNAHCEASLKKCNPFEKTGIMSISNKLKAFAKKHNITLETNTSAMRAREKKVVARTFHGAGIVVPYDKKTQLGYRELCVTNKDLEKILKRINDAESEDERKLPLSDFGEVIRLATIAGDECDFGTCLELGHDLLSSGIVHVQNAALGMLSIAYKQLDREPFLTIVRTHFQSRHNSCSLSLV